MAQTLLQKEVLQIAAQYLRALKKDSKNQITPGDFRLPPEITPTLIQNFLFDFTQTASLEELFERKEEILSLLESIGEEIFPDDPAVSPKKQVVIFPDKDQKGTQIRGAEDVQETIEDLTQQIRRLKLRRSPLKTTKPPEKVIYREAVTATNTEKEIQKTVLTVEKMVNQGLRETARRYPTLAKQLKEDPDKSSKIAHQAAQAVKRDLWTILTTGEAVRIAQTILQKETDLPRDDAYAIAEAAVPQGTKHLANRVRADHYIEMNQDNKRLTDAIKLALLNAKLTPSQTIEILGRIRSSVDNKLLTPEFAAQEPSKALKTINAAIQPALAESGLSAKTIEQAAEALASLGVAQPLQKLARVTSKWVAVSEEAKNLALATTAPTGTSEVVLEIKKYVTQFGLGGPPAVSKKDEIKAERLAVEAAKEIVKRRLRIIALAQQRGLRVQIPPAEIIKEELPQLVKKVLVEALNPEEYGADFVLKIKTGLEKDLPSSLLASVQEALETPPPQLSPAEREKATAFVKKFIAEELLLGKASPKEEVPIEQIAQTTVRNIEKEAQKSELPIESPTQTREVVLKSLRSALKEHQEQSPVLVQKIKKGMTAAMAAEPLPEFLLKNIQEVIQTLPPKLLPWEEKTITDLERKGIISPQTAAAYRKEIAQRTEEIGAFLSQRTAPGVVSRLSEQALAAYVVSMKEKDRREASEEIRSLIEQAEQVVPKNRIARNLLNRLFRRLTNEKNPLRTLENLTKSGPSKLKFPAQFRQELFKRFSDTFFHRAGWLKLDTYTGKLYSRFGREALSRGFSKLISPLRTRLASGTGRLLKMANQILPKIGKLLSRALPFIKDLLAPIIGLLSQLTSFLVGLASQVGTLFIGAVGSLVATIGAPALIAVILLILIVVIILAVVILGIQVPGSFVDLSGTGGFVSLYVEVQKTAVPNQITNNQLPTTVNYTLVIKALEKDLTNVRIEDQFSVFQQGISPSISPPSPPTPDQIGTITSTQPYTYSYSISLGPELADSIITNTITVTADVTDGPVNERVTVNALVQVGQSSSTNCFILDSSWNKPEEIAFISQAINALNASSVYVNKLCPAGPITIERDYSDPGYGGEAPHNSSRIIFYDRGPVNFSGTLHVLAHESAHILTYRNSIFYGNFLDSGISIEDGFLCSYRLNKTIAEDFPETIAVYVTYKIMSYSACNGTIDMPVDYPRHFEFARDNIFDRFEF